MESIITHAFKILTEALPISESSCYKSVYVHATVLRVPQFTLYNLQLHLDFRHTSNGGLHYTRILLYTELSSRTVWAWWLLKDAVSIYDYMTLNNAVPGE
jgi:hypothetical protein